jgi:histidine ammonia-lyase
MFGHGAAAITAEARLLAHPVSLELPTSSLAESVEDRVTLAPLGARRLYEQAGLALRIAAIELICAAQAVDLRKRVPLLGEGMRAVYAFVRSAIPFVRSGETPVTDLEDFVADLEREKINEPL